MYVPGLQSADYTTLWRRIRATEFELEQLEAVKESEDESEGVIAALDATGMKVTNRGERMRENRILDTILKGLHSVQNIHTL